MSNHPTAPDPKPTVPIQMDPIGEDTLMEEDLESSHESGKERLFGYLKWFLFIGGIGAFLYFGGGVLRGYWVSDLEQKLISKEQEIELLKKSPVEEPHSIFFEVLVKQVTSSSRGKAYLVIDSMGQPWFAISGLDFKVSEKVLLELKTDPKEKSAQVALKKIDKKEISTSHSDSHSAPHSENHEGAHDHEKNPH